MSYRGVLAVILALLAIHLAPTEAAKERNGLATDGKPCTPNSAREKLCRQCASTVTGVTEAACCQDERVFDECHHQQHGVRRRRDAADYVDDSMYSSLLAEPQVVSRARPFLGKRARYMLGKRLRNNFLGKRSDSGSYEEDTAPLIRLLEQDEHAKRARPFLGKKARPFLGKRSDQYEDDAIDELMDEMTDSDREEGVAKRARPFLGKRSRRPFLGKRTPRPFLGKREVDGLDDADGLDDGLGDEKRARPFLGKRRDENPFLPDDDDVVKRAARYMLGKREQDDVDKRRRYMLGKRSTDGKTDDDDDDDSATERAN
ncbi:hypothetical protein LSH36_49g05014 [Paralvinella palmiformis]|uniref:Uncharacterized protein n=1 Tax=Paralvinella palmiformis TaxID=53620 RepID=A0AAD9NFQ2_9ANNE|nr:hypothetical protein LSH36_49g05014 [Paralvinella palmiformis]